MLDFLARLNWSAMIITAMICFTVLRSLDNLRRIARIWLEGIKAIYGGEKK